jgi:translation initiation factor IF-1
MRRAAVLALALTLASSAMPAAAQQKPGTDRAREADRSSLGTHSVTGTVKKTTDNGLVVVGRETGQKDKEWAFAVDAGTRIDAGGKMKAANEIREGDAVTVTYANRDGKIVAQRIKVNAR